MSRGYVRYDCSGSVHGVNGLHNCPRSNSCLIVLDASFAACLRMMGGVVPLSGVILVIDFGHQGAESQQQTDETHHGFHCFHLCTYMDRSIFSSVGYSSLLSDCRIGDQHVAMAF